MEDNIFAIEIKEEPQPAAEPNNIRLDNICSDGIENLLRNIKITDYNKVAELVDLIRSRSIIIGDIDEDTGGVIDNFIRFWNIYDHEKGIPVEERTPIKLCIDSNGGNFLSTLTVIDAIENSITPVWTINIGKAYSGGLLIMISGHVRVAYKHSTFLFHEGSVGGVQGDANKFQNYADHYKALRQVMRKLMLEKTNLTEAEYTEKEKDDWWFMTDEALDKGVIDDIATGAWYC